MTESYKRGFVNRCRERGVDPNEVVKYAEYVNAREAEKNRRLTKAAQAINFTKAPNLGYAGAGAGALLGGAIGALSSREHRLRNFILGAILGGSLGGAGGYVAGHNVGPETLGKINGWLNRAYGKTKSVAQEAGRRAKGAVQAAGGAEVTPKPKTDAKPDAGKPEPAKTDNK